MVDSWLTGNVILSLSDDAIEQVSESLECHLYYTPHLEPHDSVTFSALSSLSRKYDSETEIQPCAVEFWWPDLDNPQFTPLSNLDSSSLA